MDNLIIRTANNANDATGIRIKLYSTDNVEFIPDESGTFRLKGGTKYEIGLTNVDKDDRACVVSLTVNGNPILPFHLYRADGEKRIKRMRNVFELNSKEIDLVFAPELSGAKTTGGTPYAMFSNYTGRGSTPYIRFSATFSPNPSDEPPSPFLYKIFTFNDTVRIDSTQTAGSVGIIE